MCPSQCRQTSVCAYTSWRGQTSVDCSDWESPSCRRTGEDSMQGCPPTGRVVGRWRSQASTRAWAVPGAPPSLLQTQGAGLVDVAAALRAGRREGGWDARGRRAGKFVRRRRRGLQPRDAHGPRRPQHASEPCSPWVSRFPAARPAGVPDPISARPPAPLHARTRGGPPGGGPGRQALAGRWKGTSLYFLPCSFLP